MKKLLFLNFYGVKIQLQSDWIELLDVLEKDFYFFVENSSQNLSSQKSLKLEIFNQSIPFDKIPKKRPTAQRQTVLVTEEESYKFCDYYGKGLMIFNKKEKSGKYFSTNFEKSHEVVMLYVLSVVGKELDLIGLHKLHAFAIAYKSSILVCMMPSKGGKSTLLKNLLKFPDVQILSDDIPLINERGLVKAFPLKLSFEEFPSDLNIDNPEENIYTLKRELYGAKSVVSIKGLKERIFSENKPIKRIFLIEAFRFQDESTRMFEVGFFKIFSGLFKHGVIGVGTPMVLEYFWNKGLHDFYIKTVIFIKRMIAFVRLGLHAKKYHLDLGRNSANAADLIIKELDRWN